MVIIGTDVDAVVMDHGGGEDGSVGPEGPVDMGLVGKYLVGVAIEFIVPAEQQPFGMGWAWQTGEEEQEYARQGCGNIHYRSSLDRATVLYSIKTEGLTLLKTYYLYVDIQVNH